jgi:chaperonin GroEL (HSP60 family)
MASRSWTGTASAQLCVKVWKMLDILSSDGTRAGLRRGMQITGAAVGATLGPYGRSGREHDPVAARDAASSGVAVARSLRFEDRAEAAGAALLRQVAEWTEEAAGDGTAGAVVIAQLLAREAVAMVGLGFDPVALRQGIEAALVTAERHIAGLAHPAVNIGGGERTAARTIRGKPPECVVGSVVPGGGVAFLSAARTLAAYSRSTSATDRHVRLAYSVVQRALEEPFRHALQNAGIAPIRVMPRLRDHDDPERAGVSLPSGEVVDMVGAGIVDPLATLQAALRAVAAGIGLLLATEAVAADRQHRIPADQ